MSTPGAGSPQPTESGVVLFYSTSSAIRAEKVLRKAGFAFKLVPTPRHLSSDCGLALRFAWSLKEEIGRTLDLEGVEISGIHPL